MGPDQEADDDPQTDVGAPIDDPADPEVRGGPQGRTLIRPCEEDDTEAAEAAVVAQWHNWEAHGPEAEAEAAAAAEE